MLKRCAGVIFVASSLAYGAKPAPVYMDAVLKTFTPNKPVCTAPQRAIPMEVSMRTQIRMALQQEQ